MNHPLNRLINQTEQLQPMLKRLPVVINLVLIIGCAQLLSEIIWTLLDESETTTPVVAPISSMNNNAANAKQSQHCY